MYIFVSNSYKGYLLRPISAFWTQRDLLSTITYVNNKFNNHKEQWLRVVYVFCILIRWGDDGVDELHTYTYSRSICSRSIWCSMKRNKCQKVDFWLFSFSPSQSLICLIRTNSFLYWLIYSMIFCLSIYMLKSFRRYLILKNIKARSQCSIQTSPRKPWNNHHHGGWSF